MSASPALVYPSDALQPSRSPFKRPASSTVPSPRIATTTSCSGTNNTNNGSIKTIAPSGSVLTLDPTEQMNLEEKRKYIKGRKLGEGTYANVYLGHLRATPSQQVAIKKIKMQQEFRDGFVPDALREIKFLQELRHTNIILLLGVFSSKSQNLNLVLEYLPRGDLEMLIRDVDCVHYGAADIKAWMGMLCRGVWFCHENFVLHRDIKPNNLLIAADGEVKLADFGLARTFADPNVNMTSNVITRWYRPPELLFGAKHYSGAIDVWSVGMVFAELIIRNPFLPGQNDLDQVNMLCKLIGTPTEDNWPGVSNLREYTVPREVTPVWDKMAYMGRFGAAGSDGVDLLVRTLALDPKRRITMRGMLEHRYWRSDPRPTRREDLPRKEAAMELEKLAADLKRRPGMAGERKGNRGGRVARKLDFGATR